MSPLKTVSLALLPLAGWLSISAVSGTGSRAPAPALAAEHGDASARPANPATEPEFHFAGEYGLWVQESNGRVQVSWLTAEPERGHLRVLVGERQHFETRTGVGQSHTATFRAPRQGPLVLQYGSATSPADRHETTIYLDAAPRPRAPIFSGVDSLFVVGDVHGEFDSLVQLLRNARVIDEQLRWTGGRSHLVMLGDIFDRGPDVTRALWFLYGLEREAERAGGKVHVVLGNHEIMVFVNDLRYVSPKEGLIAHKHGTDYTRMYDIRQSILGKWLAGKPALLKINNVLLAHGGLSTDYLDYSVTSYHDTLATFINEDLFYRWSDPVLLAAADSAAVARRDDFFWHENSVFWYRNYVLTDTLGEALSRVLQRFEGDLHVVAHTRAPRVQERYEGRVIAVHPPNPATELLLLVWEGNGQQRRYRYTLSGTPESLDGAPRPSTPD